MKYNKEENRILISVKELVSTARRHISSSVALDEDEPTGLGLSQRYSKMYSLENEIELTLDFELDGISYRLLGTAKIDNDGRITVIRGSEATSKAQKKTELADARGCAFILAKMRNDTMGASDAELSVILINESTGEITKNDETASPALLDSFFKKCTSALSVYALPEIERVTKRLPSFKSLRFPYADIRAGQEEFIKRTYRAIIKGETLFACAPTGTGKTVSVLYPAVKALGEGKCEKVFYLTPKTTTARAASDCLSLFSERGTDIMAITLTSKEKSCDERLVCRENPRLCKYSGTRALADAVMELYKRNKPVITINDVKEVARLYTVCPYELELSYAEISDVIICDFNYLFDPAVYIRRFFDEGGEYCFLIDEAHNLTDRGREMYSAELSEGELLSLEISPLLGEASPLPSALANARADIRACLYPYLREDMRRDDSGGELGATHLSFVPSEIYDMIGTLEKKLTEAEEVAVRAADDSKNERIKAIRDLLYKVKKLAHAIELFDTGYRLFIFLKDNNLSFKAFCVDTGRAISSRLKKGQSAVFFSATLTPTAYYKATLSEGHSSSVIEVDSPFDPSQLSVSIMDKISTRYSERERTAPAITRVIAATMSAKRGHYMVFFPSFEYAETVFRAFTAKYPKIKALLQRKDMTAEEKASFIESFDNNPAEYLVGFCVMGGIYSEGIDLAGDSLIGAVVVGIGIPSISYEREAIAEYFEDKYEKGKEFSYIYPGMNRVFQAAGRVIRREDDRGVIVLIDDRFADPIYKKSIPKLWEGMEYIDDPKLLASRLTAFWQEN